jgi:hypothetical protein
MIPHQTFKRRGQLYRCLGTVEHQMQNGAWIDLYRLESTCADCGRPFICLATRRATKRGDLNRRCDEHRRRGVPAVERRPVKPRKGSTVRATASPRRAPPRCAPAAAPAIARPTLAELLA